MLAPFVIMGLGVFGLVWMLVRHKTHPFVALISAALVVSVLSPDRIIFDTSMPAGEQHEAWFLAVASCITSVTEAFGSTAGKIGIVIVMAAIIGKCMMESGAADRIVRAFSRVLGEKRVPVALVGSSFVLSIPVFFDTVFYLLVPLARSTWHRAKKRYVLFLLAAAAGAIISHPLIPPTPGPLLVAEIMDVSVGTMMMVGGLIGLCLFPVSLASCYLISAYMKDVVPSDESLEEYEPIDDAKLPSLWVSLLPVVVPILLISTGTFMQMASNNALLERAESSQSLDWENFATARLIGLGEYIATPDSVDTEPEAETSSLEGVELPVGDHGDPKLAVLREIWADDIDLFRMMSPEEYQKLQDSERTETLQEVIDGIHDIETEQIEQELLARTALWEQAVFAPYADHPRVKQVVKQLGKNPEEVSDEDRRIANRLILMTAFPHDAPDLPLYLEPQLVALWVGTVGNPSLALFIAAFLAMTPLMGKYKGKQSELWKMLEPAVMSGGMIVLITSAGGAFGAALRGTGVGDEIEKLVVAPENGGMIGILMILTAWGIASALKWAQGSSTVAMITTAGVIASFGITGEQLGFHPVYLATAIGTGSLVGSWMNDSGFWIYSRMGGLGEVDTLRSWTVIQIIVGCAGLVFTILFSRIMPLV